jgi:hypothetical protein
MRIGGGKVELVVKIGGEPVTEFTHARHGTFVECNLQHPTTYQISEPGSEAGMWPVTPYTLQLSNNYTDADIHAKVYVDGYLIAKHTIKSSSSREIIGIKDGDSTKELLFSFPAVTSTSRDDVSPDILAQLGEIKVVVHRATFKNFKVGQERGAGQGRGASSRRCARLHRQFCLLRS